MSLYAFLDKFFFIFHSVIIMFNLFGWTWEKNREPKNSIAGIAAGAPRNKENAMKSHVTNWQLLMSNMEFPGRREIK